MLLQLDIKDFVIVDQLSVAFESGFITLTGETGAGKSIMLDALSLALGGRGDASMIRQGASKTEIAATFDIRQLPPVQTWLAAQEIEAQESLILRRTLDAGGRSRIYINGVACTLQQAREVGEFLLDIHGQHAHQSLLRSEVQCQLLDAHAGLSELVAKVGKAWQAWRGAQIALQTAQTQRAQIAQEQERLSWQVNELEALALADNEWAELELEHKRLAHAASLLEGVGFSLQTLSDNEGSCLDQASLVLQRLSELASFDPELQGMAEVMQSVEAELGEVVSFLRRYSGRTELDPSRLAEVEQRIELILSCARKYRSTPQALPALLADWQAQLHALKAAVDMAALEQAVGEARQRYMQIAEQLSAKRQKAATALGKDVSALMQQLALPSGNLRIVLLPLSEGSATGLEQVEFHVSGLAGDQMRPLAKVVSGGELSRISLAIQVVTSRTAQVPTLIFDEVDVGIGGGVAEIVGRLLQTLGQERQVLCVTHLPQVAACGDWQWKVSKETDSKTGKFTSSLLLLDDNGRIEEIARMLGGVEITEITRTHAKELLGL